VIYEFPGPSEPLRQGDIFFSLPRVEISLKRILLSGEAEAGLATWSEIVEQGGEANIIVPVRSVVAIIGTQDCDAIRSRDITLFEIREFREVEGKCKQVTSPKKWKNIITQHARINQKWFYLPPDDRIGFSDKMAVDFMVTLRLSRAELEDMREFRPGRLNSVADEHFRERVGQFFRRYPYDEWYPLDDEEMAVYMKEYPDVVPFPWQPPAAPES